MGAACSSHCHNVILEPLHLRSPFKFPPVFKPNSPALEEVVARTPFTAHRDDTDTPATVLSTLAGPHSVGAGIFGFFSMREARVLRLVCTEFRDAVAATGFESKKMPDDDELFFAIERSQLAVWRKSFPNVHGVTVTPDKAYVTAAKNHRRMGGMERLGNPILNEDRETIPPFPLFGNLDPASCVHLSGIRKLNLSRCYNATITDADFVHFRGVKDLDITGLRTITDAAFVHLKGIHKLVMSYCKQAAITDAAFEHLRGIHSLTMDHCNQDTITDAAFIHLKGIRVLDMSYCSQVSITDAAFVNLRGIESLRMWNCNQSSITGATFTHLTGIDWFSTEGCGSKTSRARALLMYG